MILAAIWIRNLMLVMITFLAALGIWLVPIAFILIFWVTYDLIRGSHAR